jgi:CHAD domain-containing protein
MKKEFVKSDFSDDVQAYFAAIVEHEVAQALLWRPVAIEGVDPEGVHQLRVSLRRLMVACDVFSNPITATNLRALRKQFKKHAKSLGDARDLDVYYMTNLSHYKQQTELKKIVLKQQALAYQAVKQSLSQSQYTAFFDCIQRTYTGGERRLNSKTLEEYARNNLNQCYQQITQLIANNDLVDDLVLHELRIYFKKLRYSFDFFRPIYDEAESKSFTKKLKQIQDSLGEVHDCFVLHQIHQRLLSAPETPIKAILEAKRIERYQLGVATELKSLIPAQLQAICEHKKPW